LPYNGSTKSDNQSDLACAQRMESSDAPILRQGHKSVRALKQLHAMSPYSLASSKDPRDRLAQSRRERVDAANAGGKRCASNSSNNEGTKDPNTICNSVQDIGLRLSVYKFRYDCWYPCTVVGFDNKRRLHCCQYDCGDKQWQDLAERKLQVLGRGDDGDTTE